MNKAHVLIVEDNEGDVMLTKEGFSKSNIETNVSVAMDGWEALQFFGKIGTVMPDLVLLDINLPKMNGHEVLKAIKTNPVTKHIPTIIFSTSSHQKDIEKSYAGNANCFITKPFDADEFIDAIGSIADFWLGLAKLPARIKN